MSHFTELGCDWGERLPWLILAAREITQEKTGFSPNHLVFGHTVRGQYGQTQSAVLQADWKEPFPLTNLLDYVSGFKRRLYKAGKMAKLIWKTLKRK